MIALGAALAYSGLVALCLSMARHHEQVFQNRSVPSIRRYFLTGTGWSLLAMSAVPLVHSFGWGLGLILWTGVLTAMAMPLAMLLTYAPRIALILAVAPLPVGLVLLIPAS